MELLKISKPQAIGHLQLFWWWCVDYAPTGVLKDITDLQIARAGMWPDDAKMFVDALIKSGFLDRVKNAGPKGASPENADGVLTVHDWLDYCGELVKKRIERASAKRQKTAEIVCLPNPTVPNQTQPNRTEPEKRNVAFDFEALWARYPNKDGKKHALRHFNASVKTDQDYADIRTALENYLSSERVFKGFVKNGSTWFNDWRPWVDYKEQICQKCHGKGKFTSSTGYEISCDCQRGRNP